MLTKDLDHQLVFLGGQFEVGRQPGGHADDLVCLGGQLSGGRTEKECADQVVSLLRDLVHSVVAQRLGCQK